MSDDVLKEEVRNSLRRLAAELDAVSADKDALRERLRTVMSRIEQLCNEDTLDSYQEALRELEAFVEQIS